MSLIDKLEDLVVKVDTEYQEKMEAVIREIVPEMPEDSVRHAAELLDILHPGKAFHSATDKLLRVAALGLPQGQHLRPIGRLHQTVHDIGCLLLFQITPRARVLTSS